MRPKRDETLLLRALVLPDSRGAAAWREFTETHGDLTELFRTDKGELRRLSPLLARRLKANGANVDARMWTVLRTASMREGLRAKIYQEVLAEVVHLFRAANIPFAIIRGAAIGAQAYGDVSARHSHDIDVLLNTEIFRAAKILTAARYSKDDARPYEAGRSDVTSFVHATSLPVRLHMSLFELKGYDIPTAQLLAHSVERDLHGVTAPVLHPEIALLQTLVHASYSQTRHTLQWVPDAFALAPLVTDWESFIETVLVTRQSIPVDALLSYLRTELELEIPDFVAERVRNAAMEAPPLERDLALYGARLGSRMGVSALFATTPALFDRARLAKWLALPSAEYLRWVNSGQPGGSHGGNRVTVLTRRLLRFLRARKTPPG